MAENGSLSQNHPKSSGFLTRTLSDAETMSPVSVLDNKLPSSRSISVKNFSSCEEFGSISRGIGLVLDEETERSKNTGEFNTNGKILFGISNLKIQIPTLPSSPHAADFGIKTRDSSSSQMIMSPLWVNSPRTAMSSLSEMELSEDYTCVISHGPNPRTTHIFDNCIVHDNVVVSLSPPNTG